AQFWWGNFLRVNCPHRIERWIPWGPQLRSHGAGLAFVPCMTRVLLLGFALAAVACSGKTFPSLCANQVPAPAACATACDSSPSAANTCPSGFHCSEDSKCDTFCTATGGQCGNDYTCTSDGRCELNGKGSGSGDMPDACPSA